MRPSKRLRILVSRAGRALLSVLTLFGYLATCIGFPAVLPARTSDSTQHQTSSSAPVCQHGACGCCGRGEKCRCSQPDEDSPSEADRSSLHDTTPSPKWISAIQARQCLGLETLWFSVGPALPAEMTVSWSCEQLVAGTIEDLDWHFDTLSDRPPLPPPRGYLVAWFGR